jgi:hypothetical protein
MLKFQCLINGKYVQKFGARLKKSGIQNQQSKIVPELTFRSGTN